MNVLFIPQEISYITISVSFQLQTTPIHQTETIQEMFNGWYQTMYYILYYILILLDFIIQKYLKVNKIDLKYIQLSKYI